VAYRQAMTALGRPPRNAEEIRPYLAKLGDPANLLRSPSDGEDYVISWGIDPTRLHQLPNSTGAAQQFPIWIHETTGNNGLRWVLDGRQVHTLTDEQFRNAMIAPSTKKQA
jgi:hypothetical protein